MRTWLNTPFCFSKLFMRIEFNPSFYFICKIAFVGFMI